MSAERNFSPDEYELLSAYLDDMLNEAERMALEVRLAEDDALRAELEALRNTVSLIKALPMLKAPRNFVLTPEMVKSRTEPSRVIRFPISTIMSAAASFVLIMVGLLMLMSGRAVSNVTPSLVNEANIDVAMQLEQRGAMPTPTSTVVVMMTMGVTLESHAPAPMRMAETPTGSPATFSQIAPAMALVPTSYPTTDVTDLPFADDAVQEAIPDADTSILSVAVSLPETPSVGGVIEIMGNALPPSDTPETSRGELAVTLTPTPDETIIAPMDDSPSAINATIGVVLIMIGVIFFIITIWRWRKG